MTSVDPKGGRFFSSMPPLREQVIQHKLETTAEWEAHTELGAPKDWLYGGFAQFAGQPPRQPVFSDPDAACVRVPTSHLASQLWKYMRLGVGRRRLSSRRLRSCTWSIWVGGSNSYWCVTERATVAEAAGLHNTDLCLNASASPVRR